MSRKAVFGAAQLLLSVGLLGVAVWVARPANLKSALASPNWLYLALALVLAPGLVALRALRWHLLARSRRSDIRFSQTFHSYMGGLTLAVITPFAAGELARGALAAPDDRAAFVGLTLLDKLLDASSLVILGCVSLTVLVEGRARLLGPAIAMALVVGWIGAKPITGLLARLLPESRISKVLLRAVTAAHDVPLGTFVGCFAMALFNFTFIYVHLFIIMYAFAPEIEFEAAGLFPLITLSRIVPSIAGLGVREATAGVLFEDARYRVSSAAGVAATFLHFVILNVVPAALWVAFSGGFKRFLREVRKQK